MHGLYDGNANSFKTTLLHMTMWVGNNNVSVKHLDDGLEGVILGSANESGRDGSKWVGLKSKLVFRNAKAHSTWVNPTQPP